MRGLPVTALVAPGTVEGAVVVGAAAGGVTAVVAAAVTAQLGSVVKDPVRLPAAVVNAGSGAKVVPLNRLTVDPAVIAESVAAMAIGLAKGPAIFVPPWKIEMAKVNSTVPVRPAVLVVPVWQTTSTVAVKVPDGIVIVKAPPLMVASTVPPSGPTDSLHTTAPNPGTPVVGGAGP